MKTGSKFLVLVWKNFLLKKRHWFMTLLEVIVPVFLFIILAVIRNTLPEEAVASDPTQDEAHYYRPLDLFTKVKEERWYSQQICRYSEENRQFLYTVAREEDKVAADNMVEAINKFTSYTCSLNDLNSHPIELVFVESEEAMEKYFADYMKAEATGLSTNYTVLGGIVFRSGLSEPDGDFEYTLRPGIDDREKIEANTDKLFADNFFSGSNRESCFEQKSRWVDLGTNDWQCQESKYSLVVMVQQMVDWSYIQTVVDTEEEGLLPTSQEQLCQTDTVYADQAMPYPEQTLDDPSVFEVLQLFAAPTFTVISFAFTVPLVLKRIVEEKQQGVKELMKMMGLPSWLHWTGWYFITILTSTLTILVMVLVLVLGNIYSNTNPIILFLTLFFYSLATISFNFAQSTIFSNPNLAVALGLVLHFGTWIPGAFIQDNFFIWSTSIKLGVCLVPNLSTYFTYYILFFKETQGTGMTWSELTKPINAVDNLTLLHIWGANLITFVVFSVVLWYLDNVRPGDFGVAKKLYFPFQKSYWFGETVELQVNDKQNDMLDKKLFEQEPSKDKGVEVKGLRKVFSGMKEVVAVNNVTFNAYKGEITALLGHNGAGKTTTMSMLTGLFSPTAGTAKLNGFSILSEMEKARQSLGLCPQHNMLFPSLTVMEHLIFFGMLKGTSMSQTKKDGTFLMTKLNLMDKKNKPSTALSGGMKRKLHLAMALTGPSEILILDEPTSGMDPEARRGMWDVLQEMKLDRTIMLTTHFMEEADVLGDRIAIMADGEVKCNGSPMFLKSNLGSGFSLTITKESNTPVDQILKMVTKYVPNSRVKNENSLEVILELDVDNSSKLPDLAKALETSKQSLSFSSFGFSKTTIEDVFLRVGENRDKHDKLESSNVYKEYEVANVKKVDNLYINHMKGMLVKRMISTWRMWQTYLVLSLFSILLVIALGAVTNVSSSSEQAAPGTLDLSTLQGYDKDNVFLIDNQLDNNPAVETFLTGLKDYVTGLRTNQMMETNTSGVYVSKGEEDVIRYSRKYIVGATLSPVSPLYASQCSGQPTVPKTMITGSYNPIPYHTRPLVTNIMSNAVLRSKGGSGRILTNTHPMFYSTMDIETLQGDIFAFAPIEFMAIMGIAMCLLLGIFILFPLKERVTNAKQVQLMAGVNPIIFWVSNFLWDFLLYLVISSVLLIILYLFDTQHILHSNGGVSTMLVLLILLGLAGIPWSYIISFPFNSAPAAYAILIISSIVTGVVGPLAVYFLRKFYEPGMTTDLALISDIIRYIITWLGPYFTFGRAIVAFVDVQGINYACANSIKLEKLNSLCEMYANDITLLVDNQQVFPTLSCCDTAWGVSEDNMLCGKEFSVPVPGLPPINFTIPCIEIQSFWTFDYYSGINIDVIILTINIILYWLLLVFIETNLIKISWIKIKERIHGSVVSQPTHVDNDVQTEKDSVFLNNNVMKVMNLTKKFGKFDAVRGLTFGVREKECFGLLGVNGAGKTTTFRMLTGDEIRTSGEAFIGQVSLSKDRAKYLQSIGYCPQFDSIIEVLTGREMLTLFARIRGLRTAEGVIDSEIEKLAQFVDLTQYLDRQCGQYSGGNKRKLNVALALIGRPKVMLLDEPTTGVDPAARRKMWETINNIRKSGTSIILTSHSMEECEALCDRLAIMVRGSFQCIGGPQHIKSKFGQGFQIIVKLVSTKIVKDEGVLNALKAKVISKFDECSVTDEHMDYIHFHVANPTTPWHHLFKTMEAVKMEYKDLVQDYSVSETSLEQIFLSFARGENVKITDV